jgi:broad specificity phosphatase PhoE
MKLILVRHCTTEWNKMGMIQGQTDIPLCEEGKLEAEKLADLLVGFKIDKLVSSDLKRAAETAAIMSARLNAKIILDKRLRECNFGKIEGLLRKKAGQMMGVEDWVNNYASYDYRPYGGESREEVLSRHLAVVKECARDNMTVVLVGHGRGLNTLLFHLGHEPNLERGEYRELFI